MKTLEELREQLDSTDKEIMRLFSERMDISKEIGAVKRVSGRPLTDPSREEKVVSSRLEWLPGEYGAPGERLVRLLIGESKRVQSHGLNLYLIGMPDCGKTRMGKKLKALSGLPLADTDKVIMRTTGKTVDELFDSMGEEGFRRIEAAVLVSVAGRGGMIAALGGGTPLFGNNAEIIKSSGAVVFLDRKLEKLRGQNIANRPLLRGGSKEEIDRNIDRLYEKRHGRYLELADLVIDPDEDGADEKILTFYRNRIENH